MPRPRICRRIRFMPGVNYFKPRGIPLKDLEETILNVDEFEAIRLIDFEEMEQEKAAEKMKISQPTLSRLLKGGRKKIADSIINGKAIRIQGGNYRIFSREGMRRKMQPGRYGTYSGVVFDHCPYHFESFKEGEKEICAVVGPSCDGFDKISMSEELPSNLEIDDYLLTRNIGAYSIVSATDFNGLERAKIININNYSKK